MLLLKIILNLKSLVLIEVGDSGVLEDIDYDKTI